MAKGSRFLAVALTAGLLWSCGRISDLTYEKAAEFDGIDFPPASSSTSSQLSGNSSVSSASTSSSGAADLAGFDDGGFYYNSLSADEQQNYQILLDGVRNFESSVGGLSEDSDVVFTAAHALYLDHPEILWLQNGGGQLTYGGGEGIFEPVYLFDAEEGAYAAAQAEMAAEGFLSTVDPYASDYDKAVAVFDYLVDTIDYSEADVNCRDIYGALVEKQAVCAGYAVAAKYLFDRLDIPCITVSGDVLAEGQPHAWNIVWIDGEPYHMDVTWGDPSFEDDASVPEGFRNYTYLLMTTADILQERSIDEEVCPVPVCTSEYDYFRREGLYLESYPGDLGSILVDAYTSGENCVTVSFGDTVSMDEVTYRLFDCYEYYDFFDQAGVTVGASSYLVKDFARSLTVFFEN